MRSRPGTALLIVDVVSDFAFPDGRRLLREFRPVAGRIAALKASARAAGIPVIYANDNFGRWQSDAGSLVKRCTRPRLPGAGLVMRLAPDQHDYFLIKPRHSAFFASALEALLSYMGVWRLIIVGVTSHQCVLFTANDAHLRDYALKIPRDCIAAPFARQTRFALQYFDVVLGADTRSSARFRDWRKVGAGKRGGKPLSSSPARI